MKSVIIVGTTSMLGSEVKNQLLKEGINVIEAGRHDDSDIWVDLASNCSPIFYKPYKADVLIHCAAAFGNDSTEGLYKNFRVNIGGCSAILEIVNKAQVKKIVYAGTASSDPITNDRIDNYGFSKAEAERILEWGITRIRGSFCSLRLPQLWDTEGLCCKHQPWFGRIVGYASRGLTLKMPPSLGKRNFMHISDAAKLLVRASLTELTGVYSVPHPVSIDLFELAQSAYKVFNNGGEVLIDTNKTPFRKVEFAKENGAFTYLNFQPILTPFQGIEKIRDAGTAYKFGPIDVI